MSLSFLLPTYRRIAVFIFFSAIPMIAVIFDIPPLEVFFGMPYVLAGSKTLGALAAQIIYSYVLACIYAGAYVSIEKHLRKNYPHLNDVVEQRRLLPEKKRVTVAAGKVERKAPSRKRARKKKL
jgi:hypothetical protein